MTVIPFYFYTKLGTYQIYNSIMNKVITILKAIE